jgi:hypothetical protein
VSPQIFQPLTKICGIVPRHPEFGHREAVQKKHACTARAKGREQSEGRVARDCGEEQLLDDGLTNQMMVLDSRAMLEQLSTRDNDIRAPQYRVAYLLRTRRFVLHLMQR